MTYGLQDDLANLQCVKVYALTFEIGVFNGTQLSRCVLVSHCLEDFSSSDLLNKFLWAAGRLVETSKRTLYAKGTQIEVARLEADSVVAWFPAIVAKTIWKNNLLVEYPFWKGSELCNEIIDIKHIRPCPPRASVISFCVNDDVEGFQDDGWWPGKITEIHPKLTYTFKSATSGKKVQLHQNTLRLRYDWTDNQWKQVAQNLSGTKFTGGDRVEVSSDEEGFHGAWFQGTVVKSVGHKFLVEYDALKDDDETTPLKETIGEEHIRPSPPAIPVTNGFKVLDEIDAYTNDGWWVGVISEVLSNQKYKVYFKAYKEQDEFELEQLRRHCDWVGGRWIQASLKGQQIGSRWPFCIAIAPAADLDVGRPETFTVASKCQISGAAAFFHGVAAGIQLLLRCHCSKLRLLAGRVGAVAGLFTRTAAGP
uniref:Agenet domain-containing protein n=1 Tax=Aegilops tauschii TaxID=37682 RepID=N1R2E4_AEGTA